MSRPQTIPEALERSERGGVTFQMADGERKSYAELLALGRRVAGGLTGLGVERGDRVLLVLPTGQEFVSAFFGCNLAGVIPCQVSPPEGFGSGEMFRRRIADLARLVGATACVAEPHLAPALQEAALGLQVFDPAVLMACAEADPVVVSPEDVAFLQFTSGTTRVPKAVIIPQSAVAENTFRIGEATDMVAGSAVVSWLPMFHDMGLVSWLTSLFNDVEAVLATPMSFLRRPASWLKAITAHRGSHCPAPTFAFRYLVQRLRDRDLEGLDLSSWKTAYVGAEPIPPEVLRAFQARLEPVGLSPTTLLPCYGMAEATLALTFTPQDEPFRTARVGRAALAGGRVEEPASEDDALELTSCGPPLPGVELQVRDREGADLPEQAVGEIHVRGPALFRGYWGQEPRGEGFYATGDLGFLQGGELYVTGRKKDLIILRGQNHHPEEVEWVAAQVNGVRMGRAAAFGLSDPEQGTERLVLVVEVERRADREALEVELRRAVHAESGLPIDVLELVDPGTIPVTTSGKVRRGEVRLGFLQRRGEA